MVKRAAIDELQSIREAKKAKHSTDCLSGLSDELLLRILSNLSVYTLTVCQRVSHRFDGIARDSQLWKALYYDRFVNPRTNRLRSHRNRRTFNNTSNQSSSRVPWLDEEKLVKDGTETDWKRQYKMRNNWSRGTCDVTEIPLAGHRSEPPVLARLQDGIVYTVDAASGLRAWSYKSEQRLLAFFDLKTSGFPTSLALDPKSQDVGLQRIAIGFGDGSFSCYDYCKQEANFSHIYTHPAGPIGTLSALALAWPYLISMTDSQLLSVYAFTLEDDEGHAAVITAPQLLTSLKSHTVWPPLSLSLRISGWGPVASIAYSTPTHMSGWSAGLQELRLARDGRIIESRVTSSLEHGFHLLARRSSSDLNGEADEDDGSAFKEPSAQKHSKPTSLSYTHPYLLASHSDNTLTLYLVTSTSSKLTISTGKRLWGHTSSISGAHIAGRGKAVSVSLRGDELRVWELEGSATAAPMQARQATDGLSVQVTPEKRPSTPVRAGQLSEAIARRGSGIGLALESGFDDQIVARGWVGFDDENVVVLREDRRGSGSEALMVYDFTK